jgi:O-antigen/teichoic acid export membrane protein
MSNSMESQERSLHWQMARGATLVMLLRWSNRLSGLVSTVILARLLTPVDYGIVTIAFIVVGMVEVFGQTGQATAIIRHPNPTREHYDTAFTIRMILGLVLGASIFALAPLTTTYFQEPRATLVVEILACRTAIVGLQNIGTVNFQRDLRFHRQVLFQAYPMLISFVVTIASAYLLRNYWALVIGILTQNFFSLVLSYVMEPYRPRLSVAKFGEIWSFSAWSLFRAIGSFTANEIDKVAVGGFAGAAAMGRYNAAREIATIPSQELINPIVGVLLPVMASARNDRGKQRELYLSVLYWSALICASTGIGVSLVADDMTDLLLGSQWQDVKPLMPWFAMSFAILALSSSVYSAFDTLGRADISAKLQWTRVIGFGLAVIPTAFLTHDVKAVIIGRFLVTLLITPTLFYALSKALDVPMRSFAATLWRPLAAGLAMAAVVLAINALIDFTGPIRLALDMAAGGATFGAAVMFLWFATGRPEGPERLVWTRVRPWIAPLRRRRSAICS